jgi:integrase
MLPHIEDELSFSSPKRGKTRRERLTAPTVAALRAHKAAQNGERLKVGSLWQETELLFTTKKGTPLDVGNLTNGSFRPLLKRAGLPQIRFHDLRHTAATLLLGKGVHPKIVQEMLGHSTITQTMDTYSHVCCWPCRIRLSARWRAPFLRASVNKGKPIRTPMDSSHV